MSNDGMCSSARVLRLAASLGLAVLSAAGCDAGVDASAKAAFEQAAAARASQPGPADEIIARYVADIAETSLAYEEALEKTGFVEALGAAALMSDELFAAAPARIEAAKTVARRYREEALAETDAAIAAVHELSAGRTAGREIVRQLTDELSAAKARRAAHWDYVERIMDEQLAAWRTLNSAEGDWGLEDGVLTFTRLREKEAWDAHDGRLAALASRQQALIEEQARSVARLRALARRYSLEGGQS